MQVIKSVVIPQGQHFAGLPGTYWMLNAPAAGQSMPDTGSAQINLFHVAMIPNMWPVEGPTTLPVGEVVMSPAELVAYLRDGMKTAFRMLFTPAGGTAPPLAVGQTLEWTQDDGRAMTPIAAWLYQRQVDQPWILNGEDMAWLLKQSAQFAADFAAQWPSTETGKTGVQPQWLILGVDDADGAQIVDYVPGPGEKAAVGEHAKDVNPLADEESPPLFLALDPTWKMPTQEPPAYTTPPAGQPPAGQPPVVQPVGAAAPAKKAVWPWVAGAAAALGVIGWAVTRKPTAPSANPVSDDVTMAWKDSEALIRSKFSDRSLRSQLNAGLRAWHHGVSHAPTPGDAVVAAAVWTRLSQHDKAKLLELRDEINLAHRFDGRYVRAA